MMSTKFVASQNDKGDEKITLLREQLGGLFRRAKSDIVGLSDWPVVAPEAGQASLALARSADEANEIIEDEAGVTLPAHIVARLDEADAFALGLPPVTTLTLQLNSSGSLAEGTIRVDVKWIRRGGLPVRVDVLGARVREGGRVGRVPEPIFFAFKSALGVNSAAGPDERRAAFAELRTHLGEAIGPGIEADGFLERVRIAYAASFSLDAKTDHGRFDFDPVLFGRGVMETAEGDLVDENKASLLTAHDTQHFQRRFRGQDGGRRSYLLTDGTLLFLDPLLGRALDVVRSKQRASPQEKRDFLCSPQRVLREELQLDTGEVDEAADRLFIETQQFSERVSGIEVWQKPVLPWIKPKPNSWLPESFGLRIGNPPDTRHIELVPGEAELIASVVEKAINAGEETIDWRNEKVPATNATLQSARAISDLERQIEAETSGKVVEGAEAEQIQIYFLKIGENFEQLDYALLPRPKEKTTPFAAPDLPEGLRSTPKPHQLAGFAWLAEAWERRIPGVLLADDMGLGKTFQALMFLASLRDHAGQAKPVLIVAPTGLLKNWQAEIAQHVEPDVLGPVVEAFGSGLRNYRSAAGTDIRGGTSRLDASAWEGAGVVLTTYETMRDYHMSFARIPFAAIIFDEIQKLKNPASQMTRAAKTLNGRLQIAMTGTPVENRLQDLWSIADTVYPGFLGASRDFESNYPSTNFERLGELQQRLVGRDGDLPPFMLRRMKDDILTGLPEKRTRKYAVEMPPAQAEAYDLVLARARALRQSGEKGAMLKVLHMLRGTSLHPVPPRGVNDIDNYINQSARLKKTFEILAKIQKQGEKALLFCEDLEMQAFLATAIQERFGLKRRPMVINGSIAGHQRQEIVTTFQRSTAFFDVLILSPKAGGVGLTITAANNVIHLSRWWNPAVEDQATDRAYRIGQSKPVTIHIPMAVHPDDAIGPSSFDRRLDALMERKRSLSRGLLVPAESDRDIEELLSDVLDGRLDDLPIAEDLEAKHVPPPTNENADRTIGLDSRGPSDSGNRDGTSTDKTSGDEDVPLTASQEFVENGEAAESRIVTSNRRPILSLRTPVQAAEARVANLQRVVFEQYGPRDWTIFEQYARGAAITRLEIQDPYCCADERSRARLLNFARHFEKLAARIGSVQIIAFDADSVQSRYPESTRDQRDDIEKQWNRALATIPLHLTQRSRRAGGDLHDRFVKAELENGDRVVWDLGRGIDGVMNIKWSCVVNAFYERGSSDRSKSSWRF